MRGLLGAEQPRCQACIFNAQVGMEMLNCLYDAGALSNTGLRSGYNWIFR